MKAWLMVGLTVMWAGIAQLATAADVQSVKDGEGKEIAALLTCTSCQGAAKGKGECHMGVEDGWLNGIPCGKCLLAQNSSTPMRYPDLRFTGKLVDGSGKPIKDRFVRLFIANGWSTRTRTTDDGSFRLLLGGTLERKSGSAITLDIGKRVDTFGDKAPNFALFLVPPGYQPCPADALPRPPRKAQSKPAKKKH